jgi:hypothetical protein
MKPDLSIIDGKLPSPPYDTKSRANGFAFDLQMERIVDSDTWALCPAEIRPWCLLAWAISWIQCPIGSLPSNKKLLAARLGCSPNFLDLHWDEIMRNWVKHSDDRYYHPIVTEHVLRMLEIREKYSERQKRHRKKKQELMENVTRDTHVSHGGVTGVSVSGYSITDYSKEKEEAPISAKSGKKDASPSSQPAPSRGTRLTLDELPADWREYCEIKRPDLDPLAVFEDFEDYWKAKAGKDGVKLDWKRTWQKWVRDQRNFGKNQKPQSTKQSWVGGPTIA